MFGQLSLTKNLSNECLSQILRHPFSSQSRNIIKGFIKEKIEYYRQKLLKFLRLSFSQYCEDRIIDKILGKKRNGFYIDIGANHPEKLNNTKLFYNKGWNGINIEPDPIVFELLNRKRPRDINLNIGIALKEGAMNFYKSNCTALSTFNKEVVNSFKNYGCELEEVLELPVMPLKNVCKEYVQNKKIDFLSVDVEGFDIEVLKSNDWNKYRPTLIMVEINQDEANIDSYMKEIGYSLKYKNHTNGIYLDE